MPFAHPIAQPFIRIQTYLADGLDRTSLLNRSNSMRSNQVDDPTRSLNVLTVVHRKSLIRS